MGERKREKGRGEGRRQDGEGSKSVKERSKSVAGIPVLLFPHFEP